MTFLALALALRAALPQDAPAAQDVTAPRSDDIVVIAQLAGRERSLAECIARGCPPAEDIKATLRYAEALFLHGDYEKAFAVLRSGRNRTHSRRGEAPVEYANLMRATALIARNLGDDRVFRTSASQARAVLADNRPPGDPLLLAVSLEVGDMYLRTRQPKSAEDIYRQVRERAHVEGALTTEAAAMLRLVSLYGFQASDSTSGRSYLRKARGVAAEIAARPEPVFRRFEPVALIMIARIAAQQGDDTELDAAIAAYSRQVGPMVPVLARAAPPRMNTAKLGIPDSIARAYPVSSSGQQGGDRPPLTDARDRVPAQDFDGQWIDVSFWVRPDGRVEDVAITRQSKRLSGGWEVAVLESVAARSYVPLALDPGEPGLLRIERYTYTAPYEKVTGSIIAGRSPMSARLVMVDISPGTGRK